MDGTALTIIIIMSTAIVALGLFCFLGLQLLCDGIANTTKFVCDRRWRGRKAFDLSDEQRNHAIVLGVMFVGPDGEFFKISDNKPYQYENGVWVEKESLVVYGTLTVVGSI